MNCNDRFEDILLFESGDLDDQAKSRLDAHLRECPVCAARLAKLRAIEAHIVQSLAQPEAVPDITRLVMSRILEKQARPARRLVLAYVAGLFAATCLLLFGLDKTGLLRSPTKKQAIVAETPARVPARSGEVPREPLEKRQATPDLRPGSQLEKIPRLSPLKTAVRPPRGTGPRRSPRPADAGHGDLRIELRIEGNTSRIVVAARGVEHVLEVGIRNKSLPTPPDPEASNVKRPPLQTVVSVNQTALIMSQM